MDSENENEENVNSLEQTSGKESSVKKAANKKIEKAASEAVKKQAVSASVKIALSHIVAYLVFGLVA